MFYFFDLADLRLFPLSNVANVSLFTDYEVTSMTYINEL